MSRLYEAGRSRREIGRIIGRSASTVGRELRRNTLPRGGYKPASADRIALSRRRRLSRIERLSPLRSYVCDRLAMGWSPEQIAGRLGQEGSEHSISHELIYRFICIGLDLIGQLSDLGVRLRASDRSAQQATATGWLC